MKKIKLENRSYSCKEGIYVNFKHYSLPVYIKDKEERNLKNFLEIEDNYRGEDEDYIKCLNIEDLKRMVDEYYKVTLISQAVRCSETDKIYGKIRDFIPKEEKTIELFQKKEELEDYEMILSGFIQVKNPKSLEKLWVKEESLGSREKIKQNLEALWYKNQRLKEAFSDISGKDMILLVDENHCSLIEGEKIDFTILYSRQRYDSIVVPLNKIIREDNHIDMNTIKEKIIKEFDL